MLEMTGCFQNLGGSFDDDKEEGDVSLRGQFAYSLALTFHSGIIISVMEEGD